MNQTPNYQLNQWEATDHVKREDFNADNAKIDAALKAVAGSVPRFITGSYVGDGNKARHFSLPGRPKLALIYAEHRSTSDFYTTGILLTDICFWNFSSRSSVMLTAPNNDAALKDDGFSINSSSSLNILGYNYFYLAVI